MSCKRWAPRLRPAEELLGSAAESSLHKARDPSAQFNSKPFTGRLYLWPPITYAMVLFTLCLESSVPQGCRTTHKRYRGLSGLQESYGGATLNCCSIHGFYTTPTAKEDTQKAGTART